MSKGIVLMAKRPTIKMVQGNLSFCNSLSKSPKNNGEKSDKVYIELCKAADLFEVCSQSEFRERYAEDLFRDGFVMLEDSTVILEEGQVKLKILEYILDGGFDETIMGYRYDMICELTGLDESIVKAMQEDVNLTYNPPNLIKNALRDRHSVMRFIDMFIDVHDGNVHLAFCEMLECTYGGEVFNTKDGKYWIVVR